MKQIIAAWIEQILKFDSQQEAQTYLDELEQKGVDYAVIKREGATLRVRKQYNKNTLLREE